VEGTLPYCHVLIDSKGMSARVGKRTARGVAWLYRAENGLAWGVALSAFNFAVLIPLCKLNKKTH
jgi:hypothetical protein